VNGAAAREPLHARVADLLERAFNPIMLKELRGSLRGTRFFVAHLVILCLFAAGLLLAFAVMIPSRIGGSEEGDPSVVGRRVYMITQLLQLGVAFLVVPGLAATSISSERESLTHDLLLTTTMTARQIVWGKFTAAMTQAFTLFVSMVPLVSLCFLFGGVTVYQILANYSCLFGLATVLIAHALAISANARTTQRAVGSVYGLTFLGGILLFALLGSSWNSEYLQTAGVAYGFVSPAELGRPDVTDIVSRVLYVYLVPVFVWAAMTSLFFINATNRLKPLSANRSTPLRIYFAAVVFGAAAIAALGIRHSLPRTTPADDRSYMLMTYAILALTISLLGALFACEEPVLAPHLAREAESFRGARRFLRLLWPGSGSGAAFTILTVSLLLLASFGAFRTFTRDFDRGAWTGGLPSLPLAVALLMVFCWTVFTSMLARWLSALLPGRPLLLRTLLVLSSLFLALFPLIHWAIAEAIDRDLSDLQRRNGPFTLALSPIMAVLSTLDLSSGRRDFPLYAGPVPVPAGFAAFSLLSGLAFSILGTRAIKKLPKEGDEAAGDKVGGAGLPVPRP
jgi:ABC-type transport system involved in multi-copper enzyme maturation permease subunit